MIVVIPAYQPDEKLFGLVEEIRRDTPYSVIIVDDGSDAACAALFARLEPMATVLRHESNRGKGAAIKTALAYIQESCADTQGVVTVDADGQHLVPDIVSVCRRLLSRPDALVLGSRRFTGRVPFKSRAGNAITRLVFRLSTGVKVYDTQTGLRAFSMARIPMMLAMQGERYEYEINVLLYATRHRVPIVEVTIETVYIDKNASSHFNPVRDAWRIYKMILLFVASSLGAAALDYVMVLALAAVFAGHAQQLLFSVVGARAVSSLANYSINRNLVFNDRSFSSIVRYYLLTALLLAANYGLMVLVTRVMPIAVGKIFVEAALYPLSFYLQRKYVFPARNEGAV